MAAVPPRLTPLASLSTGSLARIAEIRGGRGLTHKLLGLGLRVGSQVSVLHQRGRGLVLSSAETRVAIGGGIADQLMVETPGCGRHPAQQPLTTPASRKKSRRPGLVLGSVPPPYFKTRNLHHGLL